MSKLTPLTCTKIDHCIYLLGQLKLSKFTQFRLAILHQISDILKDVAMDV